MIAIIDYGAGNIRSVEKALMHIGCEGEVTQDPSVLMKADGAVLPGVGSFGDAMHELRGRELEAPIKAFVASGKPFLGICLGAQMLFEVSDEIRPTKGLGLLPGRVQKIETDLKLPQIGWNSLQYHKQDPLLMGVPEGAYVFFVHTFKMCPSDSNDLIASCDYNDQVTALVGRGQMYGSQFHPEKSGEVGMTILRNFGNMVGGAE